MNRTGVVIAVGMAQTLAWASSYYLPAVLADPMAASLGVTPTFVFGAFSVSLVLMSFLGPAIGRHIDEFGGRKVLVSSALVLPLGLVLLAAAQGPWSLGLAWIVLGLGMALGLYDTAFAALAASPVAARLRHFSFWLREAADITGWVETWNQNPKPFVWTKTADQILRSLAGYCAAINK